MANERIIEIFSAGCQACGDAIELVERLVCPWDVVRVLDMNDASVARRAKELGIRAVPAVVVNGRLAPCCRDGGPSERGLRDAHIGQPVF